MVDAGWLSGCAPFWPDVSFTHLSSDLDPVRNISPRSIAYQFSGSARFPGEYTCRAISVETAIQRRYWHTDGFLCITCFFSAMQRCATRYVERVNPWEAHSISEEVVSLTMFLVRCSWKQIINRRRTLFSPADDWNFRELWCCKIVVYAYQKKHDVTDSNYSWSESLKNGVPEQLG